MMKNTHGIAIVLVCLESVTWIIFIEASLVMLSLKFTSQGNGWRNFKP